MPEAGSPASVDERTWSDAIERAVQGIGVRPVYQPIVDLARGTVAGYEALARFDSGPSAPPNEWFAAAARRASVDALEAAVLTAALAARATLPANTFLTVNIEPESLHSTLVMEVLRRHAPLNGVVVEITEHRELGDATDVAIALDRIRRLGALLAVDDAGAGYSGLQQILTLRPHILKIDRSLVEGVDRDEAKAALLEMLGVFANRIDAWVLAEGIETADEARRCVALGFPLAQGWFFARPAAPWAGVDDRASAVLRDLVRDPRQRRCTTGLRDLLVFAPSLDADRAAPSDLFADAAVRHVVITHRDRPAGLLTPESAIAGELLRPLVANLASDPGDVAHRLATRLDGDTVLPVIVTDDAGRYVGIIPVTRLLASLGRAIS